MAAALALVVLALYTRKYPPGLPLLPDLSAPDPGKLASAARTTLALVALNIAALGGAIPFRALCRVEERGLSVVLRLVFGLFALAHAVLLLGLLGVLTARSAAVVAAVAGLAGIPTILRAVRGGAATRVPRPASLERPLVGAVIGLGLLLALLSAFVPTYGWDALTYHLALPERVLRTGHLEFSPFSIFTALPLLTQMLYAVALALDGPALAKLLHLELAALVLVALASIGGRAGRFAALFGPLCLLADPLFHWEAVRVYTDLPLALVSVLAVHAVLEWDRAGDRAAGIRAVILSGLCAAIRYQGGAVGVALAAAILVKGRQPWRRRVALGVALGIGTLVLLAPWLLRNVLTTGTPFALSAFDPVFLRQMAAFHQSVGMGHGLFGLLAAPFNLTFRTTPGVYVDSFGYQIGPLYLIATLFALGACLRRPEIALPLRAAAVLFVAWFLSVQEARYLFPAAMMVTVAGSRAFERLVGGATSALRGVLVGIPAAAAVLTLVTAWNESGRVYRAAFGDIPWADVRRAEPVERIGDVLRADRRPGIRVLALLESRTWHLRGVDSIPYHVNEGSPVLLDVHRALDGGRLCQWLAAQGVTHIVVNMANARRLPPHFVEGYSAPDYEDDLRRLQEFVRISARPVARAGDASLSLLLPPDQCREPEHDAPPPAGVSSAPPMRLPAGGSGVRASS